MAKIVAIAGVPHNPLLPGLQGQSDLTEPQAATLERFQDFRHRIEDSKPDRLVIVSSDHVRQWFMDNMPAFLVGKASSIRTTFPDEITAYGLEPSVVSGDEDLADAILGVGEVTSSIDFSYSNEFGLDHAFSVPLHFLNPGGVLPIVPVFTNGMAPPYPTSSRFAALGRHLRAALTDDAVQGRVAVIVSGHLSVEIGGPRMFSGGPYDSAFDEQATDWIRTGDLDSLIRTCTAERLESSGNLSHQFLNFATGMALAGGPASHAEWIRTQAESLPFFWWEYSTTGGIDG